MANFNRRSSAWRITPPAVLLALVLLASLALALLPAQIAQTLRASWREALLPGQRTISATASSLAAAWEKLPVFGAIAKSDEANQKIAELTDELRRRDLELQLAHSNRTLEAASDAENSTPPLLISQVIPARVLGRQAKAFLQSQDILDVGRSRGATVDALVLDNLPPVVDEGRDGEVKTSRLVLAGSSIWGRIAEVGPHTSTVRRVTDSGFRDLVQLATPTGSRLQFTARGVLVGAGQRLCKVEMVEVTKPVAVGDLVFTADDGVLDAPLLYGKVVRLDRKPGDAHWQIWMEPAVNPASPPARIAVLKLELNPARIAETTDTTKSVPH